MLDIWLSWNFGWVGDHAELDIWWVGLEWRFGCEGLGWNFCCVRDSVLLEVGDLAGLCIWFGWRSG